MPCEKLVLDLANRIGRVIDAFEDEHELRANGTVTLHAQLGTLVSSLAGLVPEDRERTLATIHARIDDLVAEVVKEAGGPEREVQP